MFLKRVPVGALDANCFVLCDDETKIGAVIDPGDFDGNVRKTIELSGMTELKYILCTHGHFDHICGVAKIKKEYPEAKVYIGKEDVPYLTDGRRSLATIFKADFEPCPPDKELSQGDTFSIGNIEVEVHNAPGHTPGGVLYVLKNEKIIFTGDTLFSGSIGKVTFPGGDADAMFRTLEMLKTFPANYNIFPGHGEGSTIGYEMKTNIFLK